MSRRAVLPWPGADRRPQPHRPRLGFGVGDLPLAQMDVAAAAVAGPNALIRALIILSDVVCADETPIRARAEVPHISTAAKHGADVLTTLRDAITGQPWMPPVPARR